MSLLTPLALLVGALAIPILLLYMLRLRRREVIVSSNMLWRQLLQDREANTPWQKLRRSLLLLLQLLILLLLTLALARPFILVPAVSAGQIALLLDASASMNATDSADGTRFAEAQRRALEIVETMGTDDVMTVIRVADAPQVLAAYTGDHEALRAAIQAAQPSAAAANWGAALTLAAAGARSAAGDGDISTVIISDGGLGAAAELPPIPGTLRYVPVGTSGDNLAIDALALRALPGEAPQLFAQIVNYSDRDADAVFALRVDGELFTAERYTIPAGAALPVVSAALPAAFRTIQAGLTLPSDSTFVDYLPNDDAAYAVAPGGGTRTALVMTAGNLFLEQMLRTLPGVQPFSGDVNIGLPSGRYDLYVFDGWQPAALPAEGDLLIINPTVSTPLFDVGGLTENIGTIRVETNDPRMAFVDFDNVSLLRFKEVSAPWADALIAADGGALLLAGEVDGRQIAILTFDLRDSDLPLQIAFPVLMSALLDWFAPPSLLEVGEDGGAQTAFQPGASVGLQAPPGADALRVTLPDGMVRAVPPNAPIFADMAQPGLYRVEAFDLDTPMASADFAVNLFDAGESAIAPRAELTLGAVIIPQTAEEAVGQREFWSLLALLALAVLLLEWWVYHRRSRVIFRERRAGVRG